MMGKDDSVASHLNIFKIICQFSTKIPNVKIQTMTACYNYGRKILIANMSNDKDVIYMVEHFPAVQVKKFAPIHINIFSSGKVTLTGLRDENDLPRIQLYLDQLVCNYFV